MTVNHEKLITDHWHGYTLPLLEAAGAEPQEIRLAEFVYRAAWLHGVKHQVEADNAP